jgi:hypothetical protein
MADIYVNGDSGADGNPGTQALPKRTIAGGYNAMNPNDTLFLRGTFVDQTIYSHWEPGAGNFGVPGGTGGNYTKVHNWPGFTPRVTQSNPTGFVFGTEMYGEPANHIEISGIEFDGVYGSKWQGYESDNSGFPHHIRFINNLVHDTVTVGILIFSSFTGTDGVYGHRGGEHYISFNTWYNIGIGSPGYIPGINTVYGTGSDTLLEHNIMHDSVWGIAIYDSGLGTMNNVVVRNNLSYRMRRMDLNPWISPSTSGINGGHTHGPASPGGGHLLYNNVEYDSYGGHISVYFGAVNTRIFNNSCYNNVDGLGTPSYFADGSGNQIRNCIGYLGFGAPSTVGGAVQSNNLTTNPNFVNPGAGNLHLQAGSAAINAGLNLFAQGVTTDFDLVARPSSGAFEIGAFEFGGVAPGLARRVRTGIAEGVGTGLYS